MGLRGPKPRLYAFDGCALSLHDWSARLGIPYGTFRTRLEAGWPLRSVLMTDLRITRWKDVAALLAQGWRIDGFDVVSPAGERRGAWGNAIRACKDRGLIKRSRPTSSAEPT